MQVWRCCPYRDRGLRDLAGPLAAQLPLPQGLAVEVPDGAGQPGAGVAHLPSRAAQPRLGADTVLSNHPQLLKKNKKNPPQLLKKKKKKKTHARFSPQSKGFD